MHLIKHFDNIDCEDFDDEDGASNKIAPRNTVLVFLPGIHEIVRMETILKENWHLM